MRLLIVSNRLPFTAVREEGEIKLKPSSGGLVSGISSYLDFMKNSPVSDFEYLWLGWPGTWVEETLQKKFSEEVSKNHSVVPVFIQEEEMENFYQGLCNKTIWPLFHYFPSYARYLEENWTVYKKINEQFCEKICEIVAEDDTIWIHDYHLMLLPQMLREKLGNKYKIGFFLHIPFPSFEVYRIMPSRWREELLRGLLGADLVGFHTNEYTHSFLRSVLRILGLPHEMGRISHEGRVIKADTFPIGIDFEKFSGSTEKENVKKETAEIKTKLKNLKTIFSVDRLDYTKGIPNRLEAFKLFLKNNPDYIKKVVFILAIVPSRVGIDHYQEIKNELDKLVGNINSEFGDIDWQPVIYQYRNIPFENLVALYAAGDVALITPLRDGMNLVAKEYLACQKNAAGVLILSEMAGVAKELTEAVIINPNDIKETAAAIKTALEMDGKTALNNLKMMQERLRNYNVVEWARDFLGNLEKTRLKSVEMDVKIITQDYLKKIAKDFQKAQKKLILLDYDGTLVPFDRNPAKAKPDEELLNLLLGISAKAETAILSGRDANFLSKNFDSLNIGLSAEHGAWIKEKGGTWQMRVHSDTSWKKEMLNIFKVYSNRLPGSFLEEKTFSLALHYRKCDPEMAEIRVKEFIDEMVNYTSNLNLQILRGSKVVEIRNYEVNKAGAGMFFINKEPYDFILFMGDDWTDEDLFRALKDKNAYTVKVGLDASIAKLNVYDWKKARNLIKELADA